MKPKDAIKMSWEQRAEFVKSVKDQRERVQKRVGQMIEKAIADTRYKVICIKAPIGSGKTRGIARAVVKQQDTPFTIFVKTHELAGEYRKEIHDQVSEINREDPNNQIPDVEPHTYEGRNKDNCEKYDEIQRAFKRGLKSVVDVCYRCPKRPKCPLCDWRRFPPLSDTRVVIATYPMFPMIAKGHRKWNDVERVFVVDENYFETLMVPKIYDYKEISGFWNRLRDFAKNEEMEICAEAEELHKKIHSEEYNEHYRIVEPIDRDFKVDKDAETAWNKYFGDHEKSTNAYNLWYEFLSGIRHGALVTRHRPELRHSSVAFRPELRKLVSLKNKLIILDATYRHKTSYLETMLDVEEKEIRPPKLRIAKSPGLSMNYYPFCNVPNRAEKVNLPRVKDWIDWVLENNHYGATKKYCLICFKSYREELEKYLDEKWKPEGFSFEFFHFGDETGSNKAKNATNAIVLGKLLLPPHRIQAMFLGKKEKDQLHWKFHSTEGIKFVDDDLQAEYANHSFRSSYQGVGRSRFLTHFVVVHMLCRATSMAAKWKEMILPENYFEVSEDESELFKRIGRPSAHHEIVDAVFEILETAPYCSPRDVKRYANVHENTFKKYRDQILEEYSDRLGLVELKPRRGRPSKCFFLKETPEEVSLQSPPI